ncbi:MAG: transketolase [Candidatus Aminicenantes bacterium]|nr:transketolase [Candidatus Aminicenantes bacterium]MDH5744408.1 transketolase [Candidatus Aminicenantes bacterium]
MDKKKDLEKIAQRLRIHAFKMTTKAGSGHPTTCSSMAELAACLFFDEMRYNIHDPYDWSNDEFVLSKGHAAPILWAAYAEAGIVSPRSLMNLRKITSSLEGHPTPRMRWIKGATGSLGQGLSVGVGLALAMKLGKCPRRVYVMMGDGECAEGAVWEAANTGALLGLDNLCAILDINRLGQSDPTMHGHDLDAYKRKFLAFGWNAVKIDGHSISQILSAFQKARESKKPTAILAKTIKGKGVSFLEDRNGWHGKPLKEEELRRALEELGPLPEIDAKKYVKKPNKLKTPQWKKEFRFRRNTYDKKTATRRAYGNALVSLGKINDWVVVIDGDVKNSTYAEDFFGVFPLRSFEIYIAEQNMVGIGIGMAARGYIPFIATFAAFLCRAHDQIRMAAYSFSNMKLVGSHVGVSIGADGPSQMGLEDLAIFRPIPGCAVLYPSDAYSTESCVESMARYKGMTYLRTTRPGTPILYKKDETFPIGGSKVLKRSQKDMVTVIAAGITVHEAIKAYEGLKKENISIRIIDAYSVQPLDRGIIDEVKRAGGKAVVVEDHFRSGGLGDAVASLLNGSAEMVHLAINELPRSGEPDELLTKYGISATHIKQAVKRLIQKRS